MQSFRNLIFWLLMGLALPHSASAQRPAFHRQYAFGPKSQMFQVDTTLNIKRKRRISAIAAGGYGVAALYLGTVWYGGEDLAPFHFFNDGHEWQQVDKFGHALGSYSASRWMISLYKWAGVPKERAMWIGGLSGFLAMSSVEVFDGFGETWGFSWWDVAANSVGSGLAVLNQGLWHEDRLQLKVSYRRSPYSYSDDPRFQDLFGSNPAEWLLKDYNGHTLWLSVNLHSFLPESNFKDKYPPWLNLAVGYGAENLEGGYDDPTSDWRTREYRQLYLSVDFDLTKIKTRSGFLHTLFRVVNIIRIPLPAVRFDREGVALRAFE
ncbi:MAG: DUF2279 domain-containing protein [Bacteroidota bacterium]